jgi:hypothetical protein
MKAPRRSTVILLGIAAVFIGLTVFVVQQCGPGAWARRARDLASDMRNSVAEERKFEPRTMIRSIQGSGTLIVSTVHFEFADPETKFARRTGRVTASADIEYAIDVSRISEADFSNIDPAKGTFTIRLDPPRPHKPRIESVEYSEIERDGFLGYTLGLFTTDQRFKDEAGKAVQKEFDKRLNDAADLDKARRNTVAILNDLYRPTGWKCDVQWREEQGGGGP